YDIMEPPDLSLLMNCVKDLATQKETNASPSSSSRPVGNPSKANFETLNKYEKPTPQYFDINKDGFEDAMDINDDPRNVYDEEPSCSFSISGREARNDPNNEKNISVQMDVTRMDDDDDESIQRGSFKGHRLPSPSSSSSNRRCLGDKLSTPGLSKKRILGSMNQSIRKGKFVSPLLKRKENRGDGSKYSRKDYSYNTLVSKRNEDTEEEIDERLKNIEPKMIELIQNE
ncbi:2199_t:CDS:2, partial [Acaulospora morrowiae]